MKKKPEYPAVPATEKELKAEARQLTRWLKGKTVQRVWRHRATEVGIQFEDGARLFIDHCANGLEWSGARAYPKRTR